MYNASSPVRKATLLTAVLVLFSLAAGAVDFNKGSTVAMCDSFGKTWSVTANNCSPGSPLSFCLTGHRDTLNLNGCGGGPQAMWGVSTGVRYLFEAYTVESTGCSSTFWEGVGQNIPKGKISGNVFNSSGPFTSFTIVQGACAASAAPVSKDPSSLIK